MPSVRNAYYFPGHLPNPWIGRKVGVAERRQHVPNQDCLANQTQAAAEPQHMLAVMVMLLGLQLMGPAILTSTGYFSRVLAMFPVAVPHVFALMALVGGLIVIGGLALFLEGLRRNAAS